MRIMTHLKQKNKLCIIIYYIKMKTFENMIICQMSF